MPIDPADFSVVWGTPRNGIVWAKITHDPSGRGFGLKASKLVTDAWLASGDPAAARNQWVNAAALEYLERVLDEGSDIDIRERLIVQAQRHRDNVIDAQQFCEQVKADYPAHASRIPTITVTGGDD